PYQIEVQDQGLNDTGTYVAFLQRLTAAVACESMLVCVIDAAGERRSEERRGGKVCIKGGAAELGEITVRVGTPGVRNFNAQGRLFTPRGGPAASCGGFNGAQHRFGPRPDCGDVPACENPYQIEVQDQGLNDTGTYVAFLQRLTAAVACESMLDCVIDAAVES